MSDRTTGSPQIALRDLAEDINARLRRASRRIKWHSGTPDVYGSDPVDVPRTDFSFGREFTDTLVSLEVDPGRWTFMGSAFWVVETTSATLFNANSGLGIVVNGTDIIGRSDRISRITNTATKSSHFASGAFVATETSLVELRAYALYFEPFGTSNFQENRLSAVGG